MLLPECITTFLYFSNIFFKKVGVYNKSKLFPWYYILIFLLSFFCILICYVLYSTSGSSSHMYSPQASTQLMYVGGAVRKISLLPWGNSKVPVRVLITSPGTYSLGVISLTSLRKNASKDKSEQPIPQICQLQTAVTVRQASRNHGTHSTWWCWVEKVRLCASVVWVCSHQKTVLEVFEALEHRPRELNSEVNFILYFKQ